MEWRTLPRFPAYEISEHGNVRRIIAAPGLAFAGRVLKCRPEHNRGGYMRVAITGPTGMTKAAVHRLVCEAFNGPPPSPCAQVAHYDGNPANNHYSNLRWATPKENCADKKRHGTQVAGEAHGASKLTWQDVRAIRQSTGVSQRKLARTYGVSQQNIWQILHHTRWQEPAAERSIKRGE